MQAVIEDPNFEGFCKGTKDMIHVGDFDADGRTDLICRMNDGEKYYIGLTGEYKFHSFTNRNHWAIKHYFHIILTF